MKVSVIGYAECHRAGQISLRSLPASREGQNDAKIVLYEESMPLSTSWPCLSQMALGMLHGQQDVWSYLVIPLNDCKLLRVLA